MEGLTHRYPTKVLAEMLSTCPQYCGHCTRMDLVGNDVPQVEKHRFALPQPERYEKILDYLRRTPGVRDVVVSGGDVANLPIQTLESFVSQLLDIENIRDIRLASKGFMNCLRVPSNRAAIRSASISPLIRCTSLSPSRWMACGSSVVVVCRRTRAA